MILGLTGCPGSGKSVVARTLGGYGWRLIDADAIGREVVDQSPEIRHALAVAFGDDILLADGRVNRRLVATRAFQNPEGNQQLNRIVHPKLIDQVRSRIGEQRRNHELTVVDCALIFEWGIEEEFDFIICVQAALDLRIERLSTRDGRSRADIDGLIASQLPQEEKVRRSDLVISNNGSLERLETFAGLLSLLPNVTAEIPAVD
jgi:dephospho-CoA kinase